MRYSLCGRLKETTIGKVIHIEARGKVTDRRVDMISAGSVFINVPRTIESDESVYTIKRAEGIDIRIISVVELQIGDCVMIHHFPFAEPDSEESNIVIGNLKKYSKCPDSLLD